MKKVCVYKQQPNRNIPCPYIKVSPKKIIWAKTSVFFLGLFGAIDAGEETAVQFFNEWNEQVKAEIPANRLLVFEVKQGWEPLCQFLGVPVPEEPFPHLNDTQSYVDRLGRMKRFCIIIWTVAIAVLVVVVLVVVVAAVL